VSRASARAGERSGRKGENLQTRASDNRHYVRREKANGRQARMTSAFSMSGVPPDYVMPDYRMTVRFAFGGDEDFWKIG
jgi:hypothetical protein